MPPQSEQAVIKDAVIGGNVTIGNITQTIINQAQLQPNPEPKRFTVPYPRNDYFTGREAILTEIHKSLGQTGSAALSQTNAIHGLGGVGKTQTAVEYAYRYFYDQSFYSWVLWVNASDLTLASSFGSIATDLALPNHQENKLDENIAAVLRWLETNDSWLLIFDNVDDLQAVKPFRPNNPKGRILITSRIQRLESLGVGRSIELDNLEPAEAHLFLQQRTQAELIDPAEQQALSDLARALGYLPLALEQAAAYIRAKKVSFAAYLRSYQKRRLQLLEKEKPQVGNYPDSVATTWTINFEAVQASSPAAADLLRMSTFLAPNNIPCEILLLGKDQLGEELSTALAEAAEDEMVIPELLEELSRYSLIRPEDNYCYSIHRMVQEVLRDTLPPEQQQQWIDRIVNALMETFPSVEFENWWRCDRLVEHVQAIDLQQAAQTIELGWLLNQTGHFLHEQGRYSKAELLFCTGLHIYQLQLGQDHLAIANILNNLAAIYRLQGRYADAEPLLHKSLSIHRLQLGEKHLNTATSLNNLALLYFSQGRYADAEPLYLNVLHIRRSQLGEDHPDTATSLDNLALLYFSQGRYADAEPLYLDALHIKQTQLRENHPSIATSLNNLALLYSSQGDYSKAQLLYLDALYIYQLQLDQGHPDIATNLNNLAQLYCVQGRYADAEPLLHDALHIYQSQLGQDHPDVANSLNNLADLYRAQGRYGDAESLYYKALQINQSQLGQDHPDTALTLNNLALLYESQGCYAKAELLYLQALSILFNQLGENHPNTQTGWRNFIYFLQQVIEAGRVLDLSDHRLTQTMVQQLQE